MRRASLIPMLLVALGASMPSHGEEPGWDVREVRHPVLGSIKFAVQKSDVATPVRNEKILSLAYVSCQKTTEKIAIELTNAPASAPASGLGPIDLPRIVCNSRSPQGNIVKSDISASWEIGVLGDTLARGLAPAALRRCDSIEVFENLALPKAWGQESQRVTLRIPIYARELDSVFVQCGEAPAFAQAEPPPAAAPAARPAPATAPAPAPAPAPAAKPSRDE